jgi:hypothetical protein
MFEDTFLPGAGEGEGSGGEERVVMTMEGPMWAWTGSGVEGGLRGKPSVEGNGVSGWRSGH